MSVPPWMALVAVHRVEGACFYYAHEPFLEMIALLALISKDSTRNHRFAIPGIEICLDQKKITEKLFSLSSSFSLSSLLSAITLPLCYSLRWTNLNLLLYPPLTMFKTSCTSITCLMSQSKCLIWSRPYKVRVALFINVLYWRNTTEKMDDGLICLDAPYQRG